MESKNIDLTQGQRVQFKIDTLVGNGKIVGCATTGHPIIGKTYIIEPDESIASDVYPYSHFVAFEMQLTLIDK
jgi:hypothetical protein